MHCIGHLIFELGSGRELPNPAPIESDYKNVRNTQVVEVLQFIFQSRIPPSINDVSWYLCHVLEIIVLHRSLSCHSFKMQEQQQSILKEYAF